MRGCGGQAERTSRLLGVERPIHLGGPPNGRERRVGEVGDVGDLLSPSFSARRPALNSSQSVSFLVRRLARATCWIASRNLAPPGLPRCGASFAQGMRLMGDHLPAPVSSRDCIETVVSTGRYNAINSRTSAVGHTRKGSGRDFGVCFRDRDRTGGRSNERTAGCSIIERADRGSLDHRPP
jgi:hypothetical protein